MPKEIAALCSILLRMNRGGPLFFGFVALAAIGVVSILPPATKYALHTQGVLHPWLHFGAFFLVAFLLIGGAPSPRLRVLFFFGVVLFGLGTEIAEHLVENTPLELYDVFADTVGASLGLMTALFLSDR